MPFLQCRLYYVPCSNTLGHWVSCPFSRKPLLARQAFWSHLVSAGLLWSSNICSNRSGLGSRKLDLGRSRHGSHFCLHLETIKLYCKTILYEYIIKRYWGVLDTWAKATLPKALWPQPCNRKLIRSKRHATERSHPLKYTSPTGHYATNFRAI